MGGGSKKSSNPPPVTATTIDPWGEQTLDGYKQFQNQGYQPTPQTFSQAGKPNWMQGHFAMPSWGMRADDPTQQVTPDMLDPRTAMFAQQDAYNAIPQAQQARQSQMQQAMQMAAQNPYGIQGDPSGAWTPNAIQGGPQGMPPWMAQGGAPPMGNGLQPAQLPQMQQMQPQGGSVQDALARYAGRSSMLQQRPVGPPIDPMIAAYLAQQKAQKPVYGTDALGGQITSQTQGPTA